MVIPDSRKPGSIVSLVLTEQVGLVGNMEVHITQPRRRNQRLGHGIRNMFEEDDPGHVPGSVLISSNSHPLMTDGLLICQEGSLVSLPHESGRMIDISMTPQECAHDLVGIDSLLIERLRI